MSTDQPPARSAPPTSPEVTLYEFSLSHYNEKARWALDYKGIPYHSEPVLPGLHFGKIKKLSGQTSTPVLQLPTEVVSGSANIVQCVDALSPKHPLFPPSPDARKEAEKLGVPFRVFTAAELETEVKQTVWIQFLVSHRIRCW